MNSYQNITAFWQRTTLAFAAILLTVSCSSEHQDASVHAIENPSPEKLSTSIAPDDSSSWSRVVWIRDTGDGTDILGFQDQLILVGRDAREEGRERIILDTPRSYARPLITPTGQQVVFSVRTEQAVYVVNWDGSQPTQIAKGFGLAVWQDPATSTEWVYVGTQKTNSDPPSYRAIRRYRLDRQSKGQPVWNAQRVSADNFQLSADGRYAGGLFPWPKAGIADLKNGTWEELGEGCWTSLSNDGRNILWYFDGLHRNLTMVDPSSKQRWKVNINGAPELNGYEVYHPRWTNDPLHFVLTGPYTVGGRKNKIRGGGTQVEIFVGRFDPTLESVEQWFQITDNESPDFYPDAWVAPSNRSATDLRTRDISNQNNRDLSSLVVRARVKKDIAIPTPASIAPYQDGLLAIDYEIVEIVKGQYTEPNIVVANWVIRDKKILDDAMRHKNEIYEMTLNPFDSQPELEGQRLILDTEYLTLPLYFATRSKNNDQ